MAQKAQRVVAMVVGQDEDDIARPAAPGTRSSGAGVWLGAAAFVGAARRATLDAATAVARDRNVVGLGIPL
jgi:hypothetical protein